MLSAGTIYLEQQLDAQLAYNDGGAHARAAGGGFEALASSGRAAARAGSGA